MLRRYLVSNIVMTVVMYAMFYALTPVVSAHFNQVWNMVLAATTDNPIIGPLFERILLLTSN